MRASPPPYDNLRRAIPTGGVRGVHNVYVMHDPRSWRVESSVWTEVDTCCGWFLRLGALDEIVASGTLCSMRPPANVAAMVAGAFLRSLVSRGTALHDNTESRPAVRETARVGSVAGDGAPADLREESSARHGLVDWRIRS